MGTCLQSEQAQQGWTASPQQLPECPGATPACASLPADLHESSLVQRVNEAHAPRTLKHRLEDESSQVPTLLLLFLPPLLRLLGAAATGGLCCCSAACLVVLLQLGLDGRAVQAVERPRHAALHRKQPLLPLKLQLAIQASLAPVCRRGRRHVIRQRHAPPPRLHRRCGRLQEQAAPAVPGRLPAAVEGGGCHSVHGAQCVAVVALCQAQHLRRQQQNAYMSQVGQAGGGCATQATAAPAKTVAATKVQAAACTSPHLQLHSAVHEAVVCHVLAECHLQRNLRAEHSGSSARWAVLNTVLTKRLRVGLCSSTIRERSPLKWLAEVVGC